jgi:transposase
MPWKEVTTMEEKKRFIALASEWEGTFKDLCTIFTISTKTGYKYLNRYKEFGLKGLKEQSCQPKVSPNKTEAEIEILIIKTRQLHPSWGGEKLKNYLHAKGYTTLPTEKTIDRILKRNGLITAEESQKHKPWKRFEHENPNDLWQMDFKGHFATADGRCHPLTLLDDHSRYSLLIKACKDEQAETVREALINIWFT